MSTDDTVTIPEEIAREIAAGTTTSVRHDLIYRHLHGERSARELMSSILSINNRRLLNAHLHQLLTAIAIATYYMESPDAGTDRIKLYPYVRENLEGADVFLGSLELAGTTFFDWAFTTTHKSRQYVEANRGDQKPRSSDMVLIGNTVRRAIPMSRSRFSQPNRSRREARDRHDFVTRVLRKVDNRHPFTDKQRAQRLGIRIHEVGAVRIHRFHQIALLCDLDEMTLEQVLTPRATPVEITRFTNATGYKDYSLRDRAFFPRDDDRQKIWAAIDGEADDAEYDESLLRPFEDAADQKVVQFRNNKNNRGQT